MSHAADRLRHATDEAARIQGRIARASEQEARASERVARATSSLSRTQSASTAQHYQREIQQQHKEVARHQGERARLNGELARKQRDIANLQREMLQEQQRETKRTSELIRQLQESNRVQQLRMAKTSLMAIDVDSKQTTYDAFISHASEDKPDFVRPLAEALESRKLKIWYDDFQLKIGDSLRRSIDRGLADSRFGIVVLSSSFFSKNWPQYELDGLVAKENEGRKTILSLWHRVAKDDVIRYSPTLADRVALNTAMFTIDELATELAAVLRGEK